MITKGKYLILIAVLLVCRAVFAQSDLPFEVSPTNIGSANTVYLNSIPLIDSVAIDNGDYIVVLSGGTVVSYTQYYEDSTLLLNVPDSTGEKWGDVKYALYKLGRGDCFIEFDVVDFDISPGTDNQTKETLISRMETITPVLYYSNGGICSDLDKVEPIYAGGTSRGLSFSSDEGLVMDNAGNIYPSASIPGNYKVKIEGDGCVSNNEADVKIIDTEIGFEVPSINICPEKDLMTELQNYGDITIVDSNQVIIDKANNVGSADYSIINRGMGGCEVNQTMTVNYVQPEEIVLEPVYDCDKTVLIANKTYNWQQSVIVNNNISDNKFTFYRDTVFQAISKDENNCLSVKQFDVKVKRLGFESVDMQIEESSCWDYGKIKFINSKINNLIDDNYTYSLKSTLDTRQYQDINNEVHVVEGVYKLSVKDSRNCEAEYEKEVVVMRDCLDNYPVFSPNSLAPGLQGENSGDAFFIPYEGFVKIFNRNGALIKKLETPAYWDGNDMNNSPVPMGSYIMVTDKSKVLNLTVVR